MACIEQCSVFGCLFLHCPLDDWCHLINLVSFLQRNLGNNQVHQNDTVRAFFWWKVSNNHPILVVHCDDNKTLGVNIFQHFIIRYTWILTAFFAIASNCDSHLLRKACTYQPFSPNPPVHITANTLPTVQCSVCMVQQPKQFSWA